MKKAELPSSRSSGDLSASPLELVQPSKLEGNNESVFTYDDPIDYLNFELRKLRRLNPKFSLRSWAREVGYENPSYLSQVLNRDRKLKPELAAKLADSLGLDSRQKKYFELLVLGTSVRNRETFTRYKGMIRQFHPKKSVQPSSISIEMFSLISEWYHYAIVEMPQLGDFESVEKYIQKRLGRTVDMRTVREAIDRLVRLGFLDRDESGRITRGQVGYFSCDPGVSNQAIRALHRNWAELAIQAISEQSVDERDYYGTTLSFRLENLPQVREILRQAHQQVLALESKTKGEEIYQLNTQFFRLTTPVKRGQAAATKRSKAK